MKSKSSAVTSDTDGTSTEKTTTALDIHDINRKLTKWYHRKGANTAEIEKKKRAKTALCAKQCNELQILEIKKAVWSYRSAHAQKASKARLKRVDRKLIELKDENSILYHKIAAQTGLFDKRIMKLHELQYDIKVTEKRIDEWDNQLTDLVSNIRDLNQKQCKIEIKLQEYRQLFNHNNPALKENKHLSYSSKIEIASDPLSDLDFGLFLFNIRVNHTKC